MHKSRLDDTSESTEMSSGRTLVDDDKHAEECRTTSRSQQIPPKHSRCIPRPLFPLEQERRYKVKRAIDREHPLEHFEKTFDLNIGARIEPWVRLRTAAKPSLDWSVESGLDGLSYQCSVGGCSLLRRRQSLPFVSFAYVRASP